MSEGHWPTCRKTAIIDPAPFAMNLPALFEASLRRCPERVGLEFQGKQYTFGKLERRSNCLAHRLLKEGLQPGDRVAVYLQNCVELIEIYLAAAKAGFIFTPLNILYREREIEDILRDAEPRVSFSHRESDEMIKHAATGIPAIQHWYAEDLEGLTNGQPDEPPAADLSDDSIAALVYTSGTTGRPKGAMLTHGNFAANAQSLIECWRMTQDDRLLLPLPLFHVHGLGNGLHTWLALGCPMRLLERFRKETIVDELLDFRPTVFFGVPTMYEHLLRTPPAAAQEIGRRMRLFVSGSAPLPAATLEKFRGLFGHVILERYGMTETLMNTSNPYEGGRRPGSVGLPMPHVSIRLRDPASGENAADGETGEVLIQGPNVFAGYWRDPGVTKEAFTHDGYFRSGDLATRAADGYYTLQGRCKELIISGGFNVYPREIEEILQQQPGVASAAVVGVPDRLKGEIPVAFVVSDAKTPPDPAALESACRKGLASFKVPKRFLFVDELPRNALGKVQKHLLAARLNGEL